MEETTSPRLPRPSSPLHNLPAQPTSFIGREKEVAEIGRLLRDEPNCRLLTLIGPGGMGKTRLSIEAAQAVIGGFEHGICFVPLAPISNETLLPTAIAEALDIRFYGSKPPHEQLLDRLQGQHLLLVLDNFEHLLAPPTIPPQGGDKGGVNLLADILQSVPQVKLLVTSRERLNLQQEWVYELEGLTVPQTSEARFVETFEASTAYSSLTLFVERARQAQATFTPTAEDLPHISHICQLVGGMPLALELAAAWIPLMSCQEIADEIGRNFDFLATTLRDIPKRHRSLRAVFRHSWRLLTAGEQAIYRQLSVFRGGFTREAVAQVTSASLPQLANLVGKSLLRRGNNGRYEIHELLRQYAAEKLAELPAEQEDTHAAHAAYFTTFLRQRQIDLRGGRQLEAVSEIAADFENVRQCWHWLVERQDAEKLNQIVWSMFEFCEMSDRTQEGARLFQGAAEKLSFWSEETASRQQRQALAQLLTGYGWSSVRVGSNFLFGQDLLRRSVTLLRPLQPASTVALAYTLTYLGVISHFSTGDASLGRQLFDEALTLARGLEDNYLIGMGLMDLGQMIEFQGDFRRAEPYFQESAKVLGLLGEKYHRAYALNNWGRAAYGQGNYARAEQLIEEALAIRQQFSDLKGIGFSRIDLGKLAYMQGAYGKAERELQASLKVAKRVDYREQVARSYNGLGWVARARGDLTQAETYHQRSLTIYREVSARQALPMTLNGLAQVALTQQAYAQARRYLNESIAISEELTNVGEQAIALSLLGHLAVAEGDTTKATVNYQQALEILAETGAKPVALDILVGWATMLMKQEPTDTDKAQAIELLALVEHHPASEHETREKAKHLLAEWADNLPAEMMSVAETQGKTRDLEETITEILTV